MFHKKLSSKKGSTLLEALIALSAIVIILAATSGLVITSLSNSTFSRSQNQSNKLAQQGIEYIRDQIDTNAQGDTDGTTFEKFGEYSGSTRCMKEITLPPDEVFTNGVCDATGIIDDSYKREVSFTLNSSDCAPPAGALAIDTLKTVVTVYWQSGKCTLDVPFCHSQQVTSCFTDPGGGIAPAI